MICRRHPQSSVDGRLAQDRNGLHILTHVNRAADEDGTGNNDDEDNSFDD